MTQDLDSILEHIETVRNLDVGDAAGMTHAVAFDCPTRDDAPEDPLPVEEILANAPQRDGNFFVVPRIISHGD
jgi:aspartyl-tRNA(Asn)/glutamyl-tRNA(Gln) amidotransferase subunit C